MRPNLHYRRLAIHRIETAIELLIEVEATIRSQQSVGDQFEYVSHPKLADLASKLQNITNNIHNQVYHKANSEDIKA